VGFLKYYGFYVLDLINYFLEIMEIVILFQKIHTPIPKYPFYNYNIHQLVIIMELYTILSKYIK